MLILAVLGLAVASALIGWRFNRDMAFAPSRAAQGRVLLPTRCGPIEHRQAGAGVPLLVAHGSGGGQDQGMAFGGTLARHGVRVIAMSPFGYVGTPMPADASAAAQADSRRSPKAAGSTCAPHQPDAVRHARAPAARYAGHDPTPEIRVIAPGRTYRNRGETWIQKARFRSFIQRIDSFFHESGFGVSTFNGMLALMSDLVRVRRGEFDHALRLRPVVTEPAA